MYSKGGGKNGKHAWVPDSTTITSLSYLAVQIYMQVIHRQFTAITTGHLQAKKYALITSHSFLYLIPRLMGPKFTLGDVQFELTPSIYNTFLRMKAEESLLAAAVHVLNHPRQKQAVENPSGGAKKAGAGAAKAKA
jgi:hypothetical protein